MCIRWYAISPCVLNVMFRIVPVDPEILSRNNGPRSIMLRHVAKTASTLQSWKAFSILDPRFRPESLSRICLLTPARAGFTLGFDGGLGTACDGGMLEGSCPGKRGKKQSVFRLFLHLSDFLGLSSVMGDSKICATCATNSLQRLRRESLAVIRRILSLLAEGRTNSRWARNDPGVKQEADCPPANFWKY